MKMNLDFCEFLLSLAVNCVDLLSLNSSIGTDQWRIQRWGDARNVCPPHLGLISFSRSFRLKMCLIRMHSSRMRTARSSSRPAPPPPEQAPLDQAPPLGAGTPQTRRPPRADPPCGQTHACKHITLPQTSFAGDNNSLLPPSWKSWIRHY